MTLSSGEWMDRLRQSRTAAWQRLSAAFGEEFGPLTNMELRILLFCLSACISLAYFQLLPVSLPIDSYGYISGLADAHPQGYYWIIRLLGLQLLESFIPLIAFQMILAALIPVLIFNAVEPSGRLPALFAAVLALLFPYPYLMALQIYTETPYMFGTVLVVYLLSRYLKSFSTGPLLAAVLCIAAVDEIRASANLLLGSIVLMQVIVLSQHYSRHVLMQVIMVIVLALSLNLGRAAITDRNTANLGPYYAWHWVSPCVLPDGKACVSLDNGTGTRALFEEVRKMLLKRRDIYDALASDRDIRAAITDVRPEFRDYSPHSVDRLVDDLVNNVNQNLLRGPFIIHFLWTTIGRTETARLLRATIIETIWAHPAFIFSDAARGIFSIIFGKYATNERAVDNSIYWVFIPRSLEDAYLLDQFTASPNLYAQWLYGLEYRTGSDPKAKVGLGRIPETRQEAFAAYREYGNTSAIGLYLAGGLIRVIVKLACFLSLATLVLAWFARQGPLAIGILAGAWTIALTATFLQLNSLYMRQISLHVPLMLVSFGIASSAVPGFLSWCTKRRRLKR